MPDTTPPADPNVQQTTAEAVGGTTTPYHPALDTTATYPGGAGRPRAGPLPSVPGYDILAELGRGGMGVVYKARQTALDRVVALKMILAGAHAGPEHHERFRAEALAVARLQHPNLVQIHEVGEHHGLPFFSLEFVAGGSLAKQLGGTPQDPRAAAALVEALARAMHYAHSQGVVHRDLKPANVLLAACGFAEGAKPQAAFVPKITDFGLAKRLDEDSGQTASGAVMGTPSYMAPEQAAGRVHEIGPLADVYALGAILYECLTGRPPFRGTSTYDTLEQVRTQEPVPPTALQPKTPRDLETVCLKCLHKEPARRYATAEELADDLRRFLDGKPVLARRTPVWERALKWARRRPAVALLLAVSALAALALAAVVLVYTALLKDQRDLAIDAGNRATREAENARLAGEREREARLKAQDKAVRLSVGNGTRLLLDGDLTAALPWYVAALREDRRDDPGDADAAREEMHRVRLAAVLRQCPRPVHLWFHEYAVQQAAFSPDGRLVLAATFEAVHVYDAATGRPAYPPLAIGHLRHAAFSPTGKSLVTVAEVAPLGKAGEVRLWDAATGRPVRTLRHDAGVVRQALLSPDETRLLIVSGEELDPQEARVWDVAAGTPLSAPVKHAGTVVAATFSADGRRVLTAAGSEARVWDAATGTPAFAPLDHGGQITHAALSPGGRRVATTGVGRTLRLWDAATGKPAFTSPESYPLMHHAAFSPDGRSLITVGEAAGGDGGEARAWDAAAGQPRSSWRLAAKGAHVAFGPDGARALTVDEKGAVRVWMAFSGDPVTPPLRVGGGFPRAALSPDGRFLLDAGGDSIARLWDLAFGSPPAVRFRERLVRKPDDFLRAWAGGDGRSLLTAHGSDHGPWEVRVWDTATAAPLSPPLKHPAIIDFATLGPGGRVAAVDERGHVRVWERDGGRLLRTLPGEPPARAVGFAPDGRLLTVARDGTAAAWEVDTGRALAGGFACGPSVLYAAFGAEGRRLATVEGPPGAGEVEVRVRDTTTGAPVGPALKLHGNTVQACRGPWRRAW